MNTIGRVFLAAALSATMTSAAFAQAEYPNKPIRLIVPFPPGGGTDIVARVVANKLQEELKWTIVVENRPGAGGTIGLDVAAKAPADGYTIVMGQTSNLTVSPALYPRLTYNPVRDFAPVTTVATAPLVLVTRTDSPFKTVADVISAAKAKPGEINFASPGNGTVAHLTGELFQKAANVKLEHIPYKGTAQAMTDVLGGKVELYMSSVPSAMSQIKSGKIRPIVVTSAKRSSDLPNVPTMHESGYKDFDAFTWFGLLVPAGTPAPVISRLNTEVNKVLARKDVQERISAEGGNVQGSTPEAFAALIKEEIPRWAVVVKESGATID